MKTSNLNRALAIANLINLGKTPVESFEISRDWAARQFAQSLQMVRNVVRQTQVEMPWPEAPQPGRMFASFHFSLYPLLYRAMAQRSGPGVVYSLIGEQQEGHRNSLKQLAVQHGFQLEFIQSNLGMVKTLRRAIHDGIPGILLLDIPWTRLDSPPDVRYPIKGGHFKGHSSLGRLLEMIDPGYEILITKRIGKDFRIENAGHLDLPAAFQAFGQALEEDPAEYERLHQFHRFFEFDQAQNCAVTFCVQDQRYVVHTRTMQAWQVPAKLQFKNIQDGIDTFSDDPAVVAHFGKEIKNEIDYVISI
ncbi:hypothetical protein G4G28_01725 [Massilia sp. Dwa41.01b]|uniref:hypothetical protein n=1 Tax=unclassified Massilia TaxID=2609279 RepID=UPI0015FF4638|nr:MULTISPECIES: hypothetical protein [unclassified Massilia]QNA87498.1 hypothetical protein G4G28_01725 [Massilia sp. Dwa41.01b]QNA98405.1 hypothetical protein G4G31_05485 [Massilia sp. Se16.2.3]